LIVVPAKVCLSGASQEVCERDIDNPISTIAAN